MFSFRFQLYIAYRPDNLSLHAFQAVLCFQLCQEGPIPIYWAPNDAMGCLFWSVLGLQLILPSTSYIRVSFLIG